MSRASLKSGAKDAEIYAELQRRAGDQSASAEPLEVQQAYAETIECLPPSLSAQASARGLALAYARQKVLVDRLGAMALKARTASQLATAQRGLSAATGSLASLAGKLGLTAGKHAGQAKAGAAYAQQRFGNTTATGRRQAPASSAEGFSPELTAALEKARNGH